MLSRLMTRREQAILGVFAASLLVGAVSLYAYHRKPPDVTVVPVEEAIADPPIPQAAPPEPPLTVDAATQQPAAPEPAVLSVSVRGGVRSPGLYEFREGDRVQDAVDRAGGLTDKASVDAINLAARLLDGTTLHIPETTGENGAYRAHAEALAYNPPSYTIAGSRLPAAATNATPMQGATSAATALAPSSPSSSAIDLNSASNTELESLPGIGPALAQRIIAFRVKTPFQRVEDVTQVPGIGPKRLEAIRPFVTVR